MYQLLLKCSIAVYFLCCHVGAVNDTFYYIDNDHPCYDNIHLVRDQGKCSSSWAIVAASVISDRICLATKGKITAQMSSEHLLTCCKRCIKGKDTCARGYGNRGFEYVAKRGIVTEGCKPAVDRSSGSGPSKCIEKCTNSSYGKTYAGDKYFGAGYKIRSSEREILQEIETNGPVMARIKVYDDFLKHKRGVYVRKPGGKTWFYHYVKMISWGVTKRFNITGNITYYEVVNSFGTNWGYEGKTKMRRKSPQVGLITSVWGFKPKLKDILRTLAAGKSGANASQLPWRKYLFVEAVIIFVFNSL